MTNTNTLTEREKARSLGFYQVNIHKNLELYNKNPTKNKEPIDELYTNLDACRALAIKLGID